MSWKERREKREQRQRLGLNVMYLVGLVKELKKADKLTGDTEADAAILLEAFVDANPQLIASEVANVSIDWNSILEWIEKMLPLILKLIMILIMI